MLIVLNIIFTIDFVFAIDDEPGKYINRKIEIWNLFYRMMTIAFVIGSVVSGTIIWLVWRFRESNPKAKKTQYEESGK